MSRVMDAVANQAAKGVVLRMAAGLKDGQLAAVFPDGRRRLFGGGGEPSAMIRVHDEAFFRRALFGGEIGVGEAYVDGLWSSDDLVGLLEWAIDSRKSVQFDASWLTALSRVKDLRLHRGNRNTKDRARHNIHAHYDLGNDFFRLWLDETMTYSSAYFSRPDEPLAEAQRNKYGRLCEKLELGNDDHLLEIGCGWGGFAMYAAERYGCRVTSITISREQHALARERVVAAGLSGLVDIQLCDYREIEGQFDKAVSIEMLEAVGAEYYGTYFRAVDRVLKPGGRFALQTITVPDRSFEGLRDGVNWVQKYIFPGGMLPSLAEIERALHETQLVVDGVEDIGAHYVLTLQQWRERFLEQRPAVRALGFDDRFVRMWEYYLAASEAGFRTRNTGDLQVIFDKPRVRTAEDASKDLCLRDRSLVQARPPAEGDGAQDYVPAGFHR